MDLARAHRCIAPSLHGDVLVELERARRPLTGRELAARVGASQEGVRRVVGELEAQGVVNVQTAGRAHLVELNRDHVAYPVVQAMASLRLALLDRMREYVRAWTRPKPATVVLFGSAARGDAATSSDVDVLIVRRDDVDADGARWLDMMGGFADAIQRWTGNRCEIVEYTTTELRRMARSKSPLFQAIVDDGVLIYGEAPRRLVRVGAV
jgi:predicted nucleotidyltransferase